MSLNLTKTKELVIKIGTCREPPVAVSGIVQVSSLKLLDAVFHEKNYNWGYQFDNLTSKASKRRKILRVCKASGYSVQDLHDLFKNF